MHGCLPKSRYEEIEDAVIDMLEDCKVTHYPIDPFELARKLHYRLRPYSSLSKSKQEWALEVSKDGFSQLEEDEITGMTYYVIYFNDGEKNIGRLRWTILHEIGHCYLGHHCLRNLNKKVIEEEANHFAKYALAPPPLVKALDIHSVSELKRAFITSGEAAEHSIEFYHGWLGYKRHHPDLTDREIRLSSMQYRLSAQSTTRLVVDNFSFGKNATMLLVDNY